MAEEAGGRLVRAFAGGRTVRVVAVEATRAAERTRTAHGLGPEAARLAAEGLVATALMSAHIKGEERLALQLQCGEPRCAFIGEIDADGRVRARLTPPDLHAAAPLDGVLLAIKSDAHKEVYRGHSRVQGQSLQQALAAHLATSSQVEGVLRLQADTGEAGEITFAGGLLVERLPEHAVHPWITPEVFRERYEGLHDADLGDVFVGIAFGKLAGHDVELLEDRPLRWQCRCSREKVESMLGSLGVEELREMQAEGGAEVTCHFCNVTWRIPPDRLEELARLYGGSAGGPPAEA